MMGFSSMVDTLEYLHILGLDRADKTGKGPFSLIKKKNFIIFVCCEHILILKKVFWGGPGVWVFDENSLKEISCVQRDIVWEFKIWLADFLVEFFIILTFKRKFPA